MDRHDRLSGCTAGCKRYASAEEEIKPLLASRPRLLSSTDAWFPDLATIQRIEESTSGSPEAERVEVKDQSSHVQSASPVQPAGPHHEASKVAPDTM